MRTVLTFRREVVGLTYSDLTFDFVKDMLTMANVNMNGSTLLELGVGMYVLNVPNATPGTIFSLSVNDIAFPNTYAQGYFTDSFDVESSVWDSRISDHNVGGTFGKRIRNISEDVIWSGRVASATINTVSLDPADAPSAIAGAYDPSQVFILEDGNTVGQCRLVLEYSGAPNYTLTVDRDWKNGTPDLGATVVITANPGREHVNEGLARAATINTITLNASASDSNNAYIGQVVFIRSGTGEDQGRRVLSYDGTTKIATLCDPWFVIPDNSSAYVMLPTAALSYDYIAKGVLDATAALYDTTGTIGEKINDVKPYEGLTVEQDKNIRRAAEESHRARALATNKVSISTVGTNDTITVYEDDGVTVLYTIVVSGADRNNRAVTYVKNTTVDGDPYPVA